jgi:hypothetical protein
MTLKKCAYVYSVCRKRKPHTSAIFLCLLSARPPHKYIGFKICFDCGYPLKQQTRKRLNFDIIVITWPTEVESLTVIAINHFSGYIKRSSGIRTIPCLTINTVAAIARRACVRFVVDRHVWKFVTHPVFTNIYYTILCIKPLSVN